MAIMTENVLSDLHILVFPVKTNDSFRDHYNHNYRLCRISEVI